MYASVCMLCMICMILRGLPWSKVMIAAWSIRMTVFYQPLADLSIGCFEVGTSDVTASDTILQITNQLIKSMAWWLYCIAGLLSVACSSPFLTPELLLTVTLQYFIFSLWVHNIFLLNCPQSYTLPSVSDNFLPIR